MQTEKQDIEAIVEKIIEDKVPSIVAQVIEDYIRRNEERMKEFSLLERIVRVEEELKALKEVQLSLIREMNARFEAMEKRFETIEKANQQLFEAIEKRFETMEKANQQRFEAMEKANQQRFEAMEKRFEALEKRLSFLQWFMGIGFTFLALLITLLNLLH